MSKYGPTRTNLSFSRVIEIHESEISFRKAGANIATLLKDKRFESGKSKEGYSEIPIQVDTDVSIINEILKKTLAIRYIKEKPTTVKRWFRPISGPQKGKLSEGNPAYFDAVDLVWYHPNLVLLRGQDELVDEAYKSIAREIGLPRDPRYVEFTPYFLLWLLLEYLESRKEIGKDISLDQITSLKAFGMQSRTGREISIEEVDQIFNSIPATSVILDGLGLRELKCTFLVGDITLTARIYSHGGIWVYVTDYLSSKNSLDEKLAASVLLVEKLIRVYKKWSRLQKSQREPSEQKYREIGQRALTLLRELIDDGPRLRRAAQRRHRRGN